MANASILEKKPARALMVGAAAAALGIVLLLTGALDGPERTTWDLRVRALARPTAATSRIVLVLVDQESIELMSEVNSIGWPWPRSLYSFIVDFAGAAGAASLTFDFILEDEGSGTFADDQVLQAAGEAYGRLVYGAELLGDSRAAAQPWPDYLALPGLTVAGIDSERQTEITFPRASFPYRYATAPNGLLAFVNQQNDGDGVFRRYRLVGFQGDTAVPALGIAGAFASGELEPRLEFSGRRVRIGDLTIPVDREGKVLLRYTTPGRVDPETGAAADPRHQWFPAFDVAVSGYRLSFGEEPLVDPAVFRDAHVLVGFSASGLLDLRPTPLDPRAPGVTVHATMLDNLLAGEFMADLPAWASTVVIAVLAFSAAFLATYARRAAVEALILALYLALPVGIAYAGYLAGYWVPLVVPLVAAAFLAVVSANVANYVTEGAQRRFIRDAFSQYLSPTVISKLESDPNQLELGGEEREISIYFSDIEKFSTISKDLGDPKKLTHFLNDYLTPMTDIIMETGGTIDKYEGDAIIAFWGAPIEQPDHAARALTAVMRCQAALDELRDDFRGRVGRDVRQRIGVNTGRATVGNMGSRQRFDYTMIGDSVNLAARLEGANKAFGTYTMVSNETIDAAGDIYPARELGNIGVVGREDRPVRIYEPMQPAEYERRSNLLETYNQALGLFYQGEFAEARELFARVADADPVAASYLPRCDALMREPPESWNGVWILTEKG